MGKSESNFTLIQARGIPTISYAIIVLRSTKKSVTAMGASGNPRLRSGSGIFTAADAKRVNEKRRQRDEERRQAEDRTIVNEVTDRQNDGEDSFQDREAGQSQRAGETRA